MLQSILANVMSIEETTESAFSYSGFLLPIPLECIYLIIAMVSYNVVVGKGVTEALVKVMEVDPTSFFSQREVVTGLVILFLTLPLCFCKDLTKLVKVYLFALCCMGFVMMIVFAEFFMLSGILLPTSGPWKFLCWYFVPGIAILTFAITAYHIVLYTYGSTLYLEPGKWNFLRHASTIITIIIISIFGIVSYFKLIKFSKGDLSEDPPQNDDRQINVYNIFMSILILLIYPAECIFTRELLKGCILPRYEKLNSLIQSKNFYITLFLVISTYLLSLPIDCLLAVVGVNGFMTFAPFVYLLIAPFTGKFYQPGAWIKTLCLGLLLIVFGGIVSVLGEILLADKCEAFSNCLITNLIDLECYENSTGVSLSFTSQLIEFNLKRINSRVRNL